MHPGAHERNDACEMLGLRNLAGMVRECEVLAPSMNIQLWAEVAHGHGAAFNMPAGSAGSPGTGPRGFAWCLSLPEDEIKRVLLMRIVREVPALVGDFEHGIIRIQAERVGHDGEIRVPFDTEIDISTTLVGIAARDQNLDHFDHSRYLFGSAGVYIRAAHVQRIHVIEVTLGLAPAQFIPWYIQFAGLAQNIVIDVGHILDVFDRVAAKFQVADQCIEGDIGVSMTQVSGIIGANPADIHEYQLL